MKDCTLNKLDAAVIQLEAALDMYFAEKHLPAIHTLCASSLQIFEDTAASLGLQEFTLGNRLELEFGEKAKIVRSYIRKPQNYLKHSERDKNEKLELKVLHTEFLLWFAVQQAQLRNSLLDSGNMNFEKKAGAYSIWFIYKTNKLDRLVQQLVEYAHKEFHIPLVPEVLSPRTFYSWLEGSLSVVSNDSRMHDFLLKIIEDSGAMEMIAKLKDVQYANKD